MKHAMQIYVVMKIIHFITQQGLMLTGEIELLSKKKNAL